MKNRPLSSRTGIQRLGWAADKRNAITCGICRGGGSPLPGDRVLVVDDLKDIILVAIEH